MENSLEKNLRIVNSSPKEIDGGLSSRQKMNLIMEGLSDEMKKIAIKRLMQILSGEFLSINVDMTHGIGYVRSIFQYVLEMNHNNVEICDVGLIRENLSALTEEKHKMVCQGINDIREMITNDKILLPIVNEIKQESRCKDRDSKRLPSEDLLQFWAKDVGNLHYN